MKDTCMRAAKDSLQSARLRHGHFAELAADAIMCDIMDRVELKRIMQKVQETDPKTFKSIKKVWVHIIKRAAREFKV